MKKKSLAALLSGLLTVSLTGVGFASWIIVQGDTKQVTGTVNVETISDKTTTITYDWANNNGRLGYVKTNWPNYYGVEINQIHKYHENVGGFGNK